VKEILLHCDLPSPSIKQENNHAVVQDGTALLKNANHRDKKMPPVASITSLHD
jgi:hypothetical protein